ncbi:MAG TPA: hypothetical protein VLG09_00235 [Candidatus Saccharimonadales bacterium]|nr:hypothetical protein [Candidatus Saccharimonadales bacterium]
MLAVAVSMTLGLTLTGCSLQDDDQSTGTDRSSTPSAQSSVGAVKKQPAGDLIVMTWCDTLHAGYRTQQKFTIDGARIGDPVYFNVVPTDGMTDATRAGCNSSLTGAEMASAFVGGYDMIVTTKTDNGSRHAGTEYSVKTVPDPVGGVPSSNPDNFYDITGIGADSLSTVLDTPGAVGPDGKIYFTRETVGADGADSTYQLMAGDPDTPAKPVRTLKEAGIVFFPPNATKPFINSDSNASGRGCYVKGGAYGFDGSAQGLYFGTQDQLTADKGKLYAVTGASDMLNPFHVYNERHLLASTQEALYDVTISGDTAKAIPIVSAPAHYIGDAKLVGDNIVYLVSDDKGVVSLYVSPVSGGTEKSIYQFPSGTTGHVNILGTSAS